MGNKDVKEKRDIWGKIEAWAKFLAGAGALIGAVLIPIVLNKQVEENRKVQMYAQIMSQREQNDSTIRAKMFEALLSNYLKISSDNKGTPNEFNEKIVFLSLLMENFQEYFSAKHLFEDLYAKISIEKEKCKGNKDCKEYDTWRGFQQKLIYLARITASRQITMLSRVGLVTDKINIKEKCSGSTFIPLFEIKEKQRGKIKEALDNTLKKLEENKYCEYSGVEEEKDDAQKDKKEWWEDDNNITLRTNNTFSKKKFYAIDIRVEEIKDTDIKVSVSLFEYKLIGSPKPPYKNPVMIPVKKEPFVFSVSYFDMPYIDNTRLFEGDRFAIVLKAVCKGYSIDVEEECAAVQQKSVQPDNLKVQINTKKVSYPFAIFQVITFKEEFMSLRDRPLFEEMLNKVQTGKRQGLLE